MEIEENDEKELDLSFSLENENETISNIAESGMVAFYKTGDTAFLGNFSPCEIKVFNHTFKCAEAAFQWRKYDLIAKQAEKLGDGSLREVLNNCDFFGANGQEAFELNQQLANNRLFKDNYAASWLFGVRDEVMWEILNVKFTIGTHNYYRLKATGNAFLLEKREKAGVGDSYWSDFGNGEGNNMLGQMLMALRGGRDKPQVNHVDERTSEFSKREIGYEIYKDIEDIKNK